MSVDAMTDTIHLITADLLPGFTLPVADIFDL